MQLNFSVSFNSQTDASGKGIIGMWQQGEGEEKGPVAVVSKKTSPEGDTMLSAAAEVSSHQMNHRPFQVLSARNRILLREWPEDYTVVRTLELMYLLITSQQWSVLSLSLMTLLHTHTGYSFLPKSMFLCDTEWFFSSNLHWVAKVVKEVIFAPFCIKPWVV